MSAAQRQGGVFSATPPALAHRTVADGREPYLGASGRAVWEIIASLERAGEGPRDPPAGGAPSEREAALALADYLRHPDEIDAALARVPVRARPTPGG